jgi:hypothetical protein
VPVTDFSNLSVPTGEGAEITVKLSSASGDGDCATAKISNSDDSDTLEAFNLLSTIIDTQSTNYVIVVAW